MLLAASLEETRVKISIQQKIPKPADFERHVAALPIERIWTYINPLMLYGRHLGVKGQHVRALGDAQKYR